jgi:aryl-alcohol dehydrogenase-like predicted oxidoreductase
MNPSRRNVMLGAAAAGAVALVPRTVRAAPAPLNRKAIPSSGERIPVIGLGTARRYEEASTPQELADLAQTVQRFHALGGTVVDTAPVYGNAEAVIGTLTARVNGGAGFFLATKVSTSGRQAGIEQIEQSFRNLRRTTIDLVAVHNLRDIDVQLETLRALKAAGRIRYVGITTSFDRQYPAFEAAMRRETLDFVQVDYALDNRGAGERILPLAQERGMAVMVNLPFGRGRLFRATEGRPLPDWAAEFDCRSWAQFFLKHIVSHPAVTCAVPGMAQARYVDDNLGAAQGRLPDAALRLRMEGYIDAL